MRAAPRPSRTLEDLTQAVRAATAQRNAEALQALYDATFASELRPRPLSATAGEERASVRAWFEAWDEALTELVFADDGHFGLLHLAMLPRRSGFPLGLLLFNAFWLDRCGSERIEPGERRDAQPPAEAESFDQQARRLGRLLCRTNARSPLDYAAVAESLDRRLLPALLLWFLGGYLMDPLATVDPVVAANRAAAIEGFVAFHSGRDIPLPPSTIFGVASFSAGSLVEEPRPFLEVLSERIMAPTLSKQRAKGRSSKGRRKLRARPTKGLPAGPQAVMLSNWHENSAVYRCMNLVVRGKSSDGSWGLQVTRQDAPDPQALPNQWRDVPLKAVALDTIPELARTADRIRGMGLDFLMYPEVGLGNTRWLATQRLARVQAAGYGHPVTTGSSAIDYFVGGTDIEIDPAQYSERLVLLPGLGVSSEVPPAPSRPRSRPVGGVDCLLVTFATHAKMNLRLLKTWNAILGELGEGSKLLLAPGLGNQDLPAFLAELAPHLTEGVAELLPRMPRQDCIDLLHGCDIYLDSFPFGGYNTIVEALASGCIVVTLEGKRAPGRFAAAALRKVGLPEWLIAKRPEDYVAAVRRLVRDAPLRSELRAMLTPEHVAATLCADDIAPHFEAAVQWMRREGPGRSGPPMLVRAGEAPRPVELPGPT